MLPSVLAACLLLADVDVATVDPVVPMMVRCGDDLDAYARDIRDAHRRYGLRRFNIVGIGTENTHFNKTSPEDWRAFGAKIAALREKIGEPSVELGWWCCPTLKQGPKHPFERIMDDDGNRAKTGVCPLDPAFRKMFYAGVEETARAAHPAIVFFEDDYELASHGGLNKIGGCFCPRHLAAFCAVAGTNITAKQVGDMFRNRTPENRVYREIFAEVQRDSLADFAKGIRAALDRVDPTIRTCICQSWKADTDGDSSPAVARALAGPNTRPAIRFFGAAYNCENEAHVVSSTLGHMACAIAALPPDIEAFHETDPYPHNRFYNSASFLESELSGAYMCGAHQSYFYCSQYLDDPFEDPGYPDMFRRNRARLAAVREFRARSDLVGVRATYRPKEHFLVRSLPAGTTTTPYRETARFLSKLGFPFAVKKGPMSLLLGNTVETLEDAEIAELLKSGCFIDAPAAAALVARGYGDLIGVDVEKAGDSLEVFQERMTAVSGYARKGRYVNCYLLGQAIGEDNWLAKLTPSAGTEVWAEYLGLAGTRVAPSVTYFENRLGGRVGVMAQGLSGNNSSSLFSPRKQELLKLLFDKISRGALPVTSTATPSVWLLAAESRDGKELMVMVNNLAGETRDDVRLEFSAKWTGKPVCRLDADGNWVPCGMTAANWRPKRMFGYFRPEFFRVSCD